ncbi:nose resistant to fluoxetine protein 6-like protein, partial [Lasius niger]
MHHDWSNMLVLNGNIVTDTFFLLSSILLSYTELLKKEQDPKRRFNVIRLYIHRYIRMLSPYAMTIGFYATLLDKLGTGPNWDASVGTNKMYCRENWWTNLLYINNFVNVPRMCMSQSWYLATDMQLVWLSPLVLYPMLKFRSCFFIFISIIYFIFSIIVPFVITYLHGLTGTMIYYKDQEDLAQVFVEIYTKVYNRFGPYIIGLGLGYLLYNTRSYKVKLRVWQVICGWLLAILIGFSVIFGPRGMYFEDHVYNELEASFYAGFHRQVFVLSVSWIIFCCMHGYAGRSIRVKERYINADKTRIMALTLALPLIGLDPEHFSALSVKLLKLENEQNSRNSTDSGRASPSTGSESSGISSLALSSEPASAELTPVSSRPETPTKVPYKEK